MNSLPGRRVGPSTQGSRRRLGYPLGMKRLLLLACAAVAGCSPHARRTAGKMPKDLRDAPAARRAIQTPLMEPRMALPYRDLDRPVAGPFETNLALWNKAMRQAIEANGGLNKLPEALRLRIGIRLSAIDALYDRDGEGRLRPRMSKFATQAPRELMEWIEPVQRFYRNAIEKNPTVPHAVRLGPSRHYQALQRVVFGR